MGRQHSSKPVKAQTKKSPSPFRPVKSREATLVDLRGEKRTFRTTKSLSVYLYWIIERHRIFERRLSGKRGPLTKDKFLLTKHFTNVYRTLDRDTQFVVQEVIHNGPNSFQRNVLAVLLFRLFDNVHTWRYIRSVVGELEWENFDIPAIIVALDSLKEQKIGIIGRAYQMPAPEAHVIGGRSHHERLIRLLQLMMETGIVNELRHCRELCDVHAVLSMYPTMSKFLGYQVCLDLNLIPQLNLEENWALPGPGALDGLGLIFGCKFPEGFATPALRWLHGNLPSLFREAGYKTSELPSLKPGVHGLSMVDAEHSLCEYSKYSRLRAGTYQGRPFGKTKPLRPVTRSLPVNWKSSQEWELEKVTWYTQPGPESGDEYIPEKIWRSAKVAGKEYFLVRWEGYGPEDDTWELAADFESQAPEVVKVFRDKGTLINQVLTRIAAT